MIFSKRTPQKNKCTFAEESNLQNRLKEQEKQLKSILDAEEEFEKTGDLSSIIDFWENIWESGGLIFNGSKWTFRLPDLYIMTHDYLKAKEILLKIKNPDYKEKRDNYLRRIQKFL